MHPDAEMLVISYPCFNVLTEVVDHTSHTFIFAFQNHFHCFAYIHTKLPVHVFFHAKSILRKYGWLFGNLRMADAVNPEIDNEWLRVLL